MPVISWWGHATATVQESGVRVLTDPVLTNRIVHLRRRRGPAPGAAAAVADLVVISHLHADHLHLPSLAILEPGTPVLLPAGALAAVPALRRVRGPEMVEVTCGDQVRVGSVTVRAVPAAHDGRRWPIVRHRAEALGYVITGQASTYFAGDTDMFPEMPAAVGQCDVALIPVGGWGPRLGPGHLNAARAAHAVAELGATCAVPIHFGTFCPIGMNTAPGWFDRPGRDFVASVGRDGAPTTAHELRPGQSTDLRAVTGSAAPPGAEGGSGGMAGGLE